MSATRTDPPWPLPPPTPLAQVISELARTTAEACRLEAAAQAALWAGQPQRWRDLQAAAALTYRRKRELLALAAVGGRPHILSSAAIARAVLGAWTRS